MNASSSVIKKIIHISERPKCVVDGCNKTGQHCGQYRKDGYPIFRKRCAKCHSKHTASQHGLDNIMQVMAKKAGFDTVTQYTNTFHPYRKFRKTYCENIDGRLGFTCTTTIIWDGMLDVDHKDGNPSHNNEDNCQTLCKCCHAYKTNVEKDYMSPGRKALGIKG